MTAIKETMQTIQTKYLNQVQPTGKFIRHWFAKDVVRTEGVELFCEKAKAYWLTDVIATEVREVMRKQQPDKYYLEFEVDTENNGVITVRDFQNKQLFKKELWTDAPQGKIMLYLGWQGDYLIVCLPTED